MTADFWSPVRLSIQVAGLAGIIVFILGIFLARIMAKKQFRGKILLETAFLLPLVLPPSVVGFLLIVIFGKNGKLGEFIERVFNQPLMFTWWAAVIASTVVAFPLMYQSAKTGFEGIDEEIENAARVDGAGEWKLFLLVSLPLAVKSIVTGAILSSARALGEFGATLMFAGNIPGQTQTIPTAIYIAMDSGNMTLAWLWVGVIIAISFIMLFVVTFIK
ncbi:MULTISPECIES: molybdate ABC transporter permease subunit [unclassified Peribacillus]|uniref:molybdate ABC transporter permease subunit n=1 Tax=unclassified Peribacillus TaxID=2675266 RepID=UPI0019143245|nr:MULTISPECIES: molybdate ABC transporter permease subunit [unclassified Peribacillus]MBK5445283.1 molybdate ABC transporter permease subunit [Peribacillus sp. TH24]MBK5459992.1 molybdate ABC transporter permease subunit [Peribacillus sp. TH27]MBK5498183.1 molybdate ABC transporter permease subunit [Peribacillus sp. TH14]WMX56699.1 molybdate ABC transporter permease subunit [Peribacillus sp. R9-11]